MSELKDGEKPFADFKKEFIEELSGTDFRRQLNTLIAAWQHYGVTEYMEFRNMLIEKLESRPAEGCIKPDINIQEAYGRGYNEGVNVFHKQMMDLINSTPNPKPLLFDGKPCFCCKYEFEPKKYVEPPKKQEG